MLTVGLTGGIGSGKTSVSDLFENLGTPIIDTDVISRELVNNNQAIKKEIIRDFGEGVATEPVVGSSTINIDRKQLAQIVFSDKAEKHKLENILHPEIRAEVMTQLQKYQSQSTPPRYVIVVIPLLFESEFYNFIDRVLVVTAPENTRIQRIVKRDNRTLNEIRSIIASQMKDDLRTSKADDIIENNNNIGILATRVKDLHDRYSTWGGHRK